ncbi:MAG: hypothetical protein OXD54_01620 [Candidatus Poribacteria bacterium]|nr:hypothetical protein [Candidatus Poribacteria bacterium]
MELKTETARNAEITEDNISLWHKCSHCGEVSFRGELERNGFICPKCKELFALSIENRIKLLIGDDSHSDITEPLPDETNSENAITIDVIGVEENIDEFPVSLFILHPDAALQPRHLTEFAEAITCALERTIPLISVFTASPIETQCSYSEILPLYLQLEQLAQVPLPHLTILTETDVDQLTSHLPLGEIVIAESASHMDSMSRPNPQPALHAPEEQLLPEDNRELTPDISVDCYIPRAELHTVLVRLIKFFATSPKDD